MLASLRANLLERTVSRAFVGTGMKMKPPRVVHARQGQTNPELARAEDVLTISAGAIHRHYYYSEPGNPLLHSVHHSMADLLLTLIGGEINARSRVVSMSLIYRPDTCPFPEVKAYIQRRTGSATNLGNLAAIELGLQLAGHISSLEHSQLDRILASKSVWLADTLIFGVDPLTRTERRNKLLGSWRGRTEARSFGESTFTASQLGKDTESLKSNNPYQVVRIANRSCVIKVAPVGDSLPYYERLILSPDCNQLVVHSHEDAQLFTRAAAA